MEESSLEASLPNVDDELETRLARLRGEGGGSRPSQPLAGAVGLPPQPPSTTQAKMDTTLGEDLDDMSMDEVRDTTWDFQCIHSMIMLVVMSFNLIFYLNG